MHLKYSRAVSVVWQPTLQEGGRDQAHQVPPTQQLCLQVLPARWPPLRTCMQPLRLVAGSRGIQAVTCSTSQLSGCR